MEGGGGGLFSSGSFDFERGCGGELMFACVSVRERISNRNMWVFGILTFLVSNVVKWCAE